MSPLPCGERVRERAHPVRQPRDQDMIQRAKSARSSLTPPEAALWKLLRGHRLDGLKFTRQVPVGRYILDFAARRERLAIELDGDSHAGCEVYDANRTAILTEAGWTVVRFTNSDVLTNPEGVARAISERLARDPSPQPSPRRGEGA